MAATGSEDPDPAQGLRPRDHRPVDEEDRRDGRAHAGEGAGPGAAAHRDPPLLRDPLTARRQGLPRALRDAHPQAPARHRRAHAARRSSRSSASTSLPASTSRSRSKPDFGSLKVRSVQSSLSDQFGRRTFCSLRATLAPPSLRAPRSVGCPHWQLGERSGSLSRLPWDPFRGSCAATGSDRSSTDVRAGCATPRRTARHNRSALRRGPTGRSVRCEDRDIH